METEPSSQFEETDKTEWIQIVPTTSECINMTSLNNDCKAHIFKYLEWNDLLSIADSSKQFYAIVSDLFRTRYVNSYLKLGSDKKQ